MTGRPQAKGHRQRPLAFAVRRPATWSWPCLGWAQLQQSPPALLPTASRPRPCPTTRIPSMPHKPPPWTHLAAGAAAGATAAAPCAVAAAARPYSQPPTLHRHSLWLDALAEDVLPSGRRQSVRASAGRAHHSVPSGRSSCCVGRWLRLGPGVRPELIDSGPVGAGWVGEWVDGRLWGAWVAGMNCCPGAGQLDRVTMTRILM